MNTQANVAIADTLSPSDAATAPMIDLDAYCARIGYDGPRKPTLATLSALHARHPAAIPFEAIDVLLDRGIDLDPTAIDAKLIHRRRGGYCFEHNSLFKRVLTAMGFEVEGLVARVFWNRPAEAPMLPRTHMALRVRIDGQQWLADVGFGGCVPTSPLNLETTATQRTEHEAYRLLPSRGGHQLQVQIQGAWTPVYELSGEAQQDVDYVPFNWYTAAHPDSFFRRDLMVARVTAEARYGLLRNRLSVRRSDGVTHSLLDADGIEQALAEVFNLEVAAEWRPVIERAAADIAARCFRASAT
jgi:N-hydroxyarylamine O-acetyltransferase